MNFVQIVDFDWLPWQPKCYIFGKNIQKLLLRSHKGDEAETLHKCLCYYPLHNLFFFLLLFFIAVAHVVLLL